MGKFKQLAKKIIANRKKAVPVTAVDKKQDRQIAKIKRVIKSLTPETKWFEATATAAPDYNGYLASLNAGITQGTADYGQRVGDTINMKGVRLRLNANWSATGYVNYRIILFQYLTDPDGATSTASILNLLLHSTYITTANAANTPYDHDNRSSFKVWYDKSFSHHPQTLTTTNTNPGQTRHHEIDLRFKPGSKYAKVQYFAAGSTTTKNELFLLIITDGATAMSCPFVSTLYYSDV